MESADSGLIAGINAAMEFLNREKVILPDNTATGALASYVSEYKGHDFQPMGINFGIIKEPNEIAEMKFNKRNKKERRELVAELAVKSVREAVKELYV